MGFFDSAQRKGIDEFNRRAAASRPGLPSSGDISTLASNVLKYDQDLAKMKAIADSLRRSRRKRGFLSTLLGAGFQASADTKKSQSLGA